jgi:hypothetical protein
MTNRPPDTQTNLTTPSDYSRLYPEFLQVSAPNQEPALAISPYKNPSTVATEKKNVNFTNWIIIHKIDIRYNLTD